MAFRFSLESIVRLRKSVERQERQKLAQATQRVAGIRAQLTGMDESFMETQRQWRAELANANLTTVLEFGVASEAAYLCARERLQMALRNAEREFKDQVQRYRAAKQQHDTFESLRARYRRTYELELQRREQQTIDEMYLLRGRMRLPEEDLPTK
jgi:flagellar export protein FliJ